MAESTIGSGKNYETLTAWIAAIQGTPGNYEAKLETDITDNLIISTLATGTWNLQIYGDTAGAAKRKITSAASGAHMIRLADTDLVSMVISDLEIDGTGQAASNYGIYTSAGTPTLTVKRCNIHNTTSDGIRINTATSAIFENLIVHNTGGHGVYNQYVAGATTTTFKNCGIFKNGNRGVYIPVDVNQTHNFYNCLLMGNAGAAIEAGSTTPTVNVISTIASDATANHANHDTTTNSLNSKTTYASYFTDYTNNDFHLLDTAANLWAVTVDSANTPAEDFDSVTRSVDDTGPYEYVAAAGGGSGSPISGPIGGPIGGPLGG